MMTLRGNITAIIETCFSESKEKNKEIAIDRIMELIVLCKECKHQKDCERTLVLNSMYGEIGDYANLDFCSYGERIEE